jgi:hypothetical protein
MTRWKPLVCECVLVMDESWVLFNAENKCATHQSLDGQDLVQAVTDLCQANMEEPLEE